MSAGAGGVKCLLHRFFCAHTFEDSICSDATQDLLDPFHTLFTALLHKIGRAKFGCDGLSMWMPRHGNDALGAKLFGSQHTAQPNCAIANDDDRVATLHLS